MTTRTKTVDPWKFFANQEAARTAEMESQTSVEDNWDRVVREKPRQMLTPPQAARLKAGNQQVEEPAEVSEGKRMLELWQKKGVLSCQ